MYKKLLSSKFAILNATLALFLTSLSVSAGNNQELDVRGNAVDRDKAVAADAVNVAWDNYDPVTGLMVKEFIPAKKGGVEYKFRKFFAGEIKAGSVNKEYIDLVLAGAALGPGFTEGDNKIKVVLQNVMFADGNDFPLKADGNYKKPPKVAGKGKGVGAAPHLKHWAAQLGESTITITVPATPCKTVRHPNTGNPPDRTFTSSETSATWAAGRSITLIEKSAGTMALEAKNNYTSPRWEVVRNPADNGGLAALANALPTLSTNAGKTLNLSLNSIGSFSVIQYDDTDNDGNLDPGEPSCYMNIIIARVSYTSNSDQTLTRPNAITAGIGQTTHTVDGGMPQKAIVAGVFFGQFQAGQAGIEFEAKIDVVGGGADGRLGLDRLKSGWCNNSLEYTDLGTYASGATMKEYLTHDDAVFTNPFHMNKVTIAGTLPQAMNPALSANMPLLDSGRTDAATGGVTVTLGSSAESSAPAALGEQRTVTALDAPNSFADVSFPTAPLLGDLLTDYQFDLDFKAYLLVWSGTHSAAPDEAGALLYTSVIEIPWQTRATYTLAVPAGGGPLPAMTADPNNNIIKGNVTVHNPIVPMSGRGEVCAPTKVRKASAVRDAT